MQHGCIRGVTRRVDPADGRWRELDTDRWKADPLRQAVPADRDHGEGDDRCSRPRRPEALPRGADARKSGSNPGIPGEACPPSALRRRSRSAPARACGEVFRSEGAQILRIPFRAPNANAYAERFVRTIRSECLDHLLVVNARPFRVLDRMLIFHRRQLEMVLAVFIEHYNSHRPHRSLDQTPPLSMAPAAPPASRPDTTQLRRSDRLGSLIHEYKLAA